MRSKVGTIRLCSLPPMRFHVIEGNLLVRFSTVSPPVGQVCFIQFVPLCLFLSSSCTSSPFVCDCLGRGCSKIIGAVKATVHRNAWLQGFTSSNMAMSLPPTYVATLVSTHTRNVTSCLGTTFVCLTCWGTFLVARSWCITLCCASLPTPSSELK